MWFIPRPEDKIHILPKRHFGFPAHLDVATTWFICEPDCWICWEVRDEPNAISTWEDEGGR